ncbi:MAG: hypothetical protein LKF48_05365 [Prevotella sp.]|jgi:hypothetical protein|nr:hypothetical protein [Prevotella sp.]MCH4212342.1 hypothetical protein [Prevotella sp.]MCH4240286.1 hypothetical protein [Prevotella sp.]MCI1741827.1 hypothetical protein [Prevotella sp.]
MKDISNINHKKKEESHKGTTIVEPSDQQRSFEKGTAPNEETGNKTTTSEDVSDEKTFKEAIVQEATEYEAPLSSNFTLKKILGGDILNARFIRNQMGLILLIVAFIIVYISNRYGIQKDLIEISNLQTELQNAKYQALSSSSQLTERSRESQVLNLLKNNKDSVLHIANQPPYIINVPDKDE